VALRCLIVDDNVKFSESMRRLLEDEGVAVVGVAASGSEATRLARDLSPDVILVDIDLGDESGFDVARALGALAQPAPIVILISTHDEQEVADLVAASPAIGFLAKIDLNAEAIRALLSQADAALDQ
jgi:DNA-binding NarL/FixJ family response regulator